MIAAFLTNPHFSRSLAKPLACAAILAIVAMSVGGALAQRMEQRAAADRLSFGDVAENCTDCTPGQPLN